MYYQITTISNEDKGWETIDMLQYTIFFGLVAVAVVLSIIMEVKERQAGNKHIDHREREYKKCESPIERKLFNGLRSRDYIITTQYPMGRYSLDLAIVSLKIDIEADGKAYHSSPKQKAHDRKRDRYLRSKGWKVLRFTGSQINGNLNEVIKRIDKEVTTRSQGTI